MLVCGLENKNTAALVLGFDGGFLSDGAAQCFAKEIADALDAARRYDIAGHPLHCAGLDHRRVGSVHINDQLSAMNAHLGAKIFRLCIEEIDAEILVIFQNAEVPHLLSEMSVCILKIVNTHYVLLWVF